MEGERNMELNAGGTQMEIEPASVIIQMDS